MKSCRRASSSQRSSTSLGGRSRAAATEAAENSMPATLPAARISRSSSPSWPDPAFDHLAQALRDADLDLLEPCVELPPVVAHGDESAPDQVIDDVHHEQRIAVGPPVDDAAPGPAERCCPAKRSRK